MAFLLDLLQIVFTLSIFKLKTEIKDLDVT